MTPRIEIDVAEDGGREMWETVAGLAKGMDDPWTLVGGLMVQLFAYELGPNEPLRTTDDIDILADSREKPSHTETISQQLLDAGFEIKKLTVGPPPTGFTFWKGDQSVDVLAPDGTHKDPKTVGGLHTGPIPGGTQALRRSEEVEVQIKEGPSFRLRRPSLLGAILIKARALPVHADPETQRHDLILLLSLVEDPAEEAETLKKSECNWLRRIDRQLWPDKRPDPTLSRFDQDSQQRARAAFRLLTG